ncbi:MAG: hypothetical protein KF716_33280 [Anaerolineae bacterium]|nr:hypothetical protein [Anaerolineae bacterium]
MVKRLLDADASDFMAMSAADLAESIRLAEGRTIAAEANCAVQSPIETITHGELAAAMGADIISLDAYDTLKPHIPGAPKSLYDSAAPLKAYKQLVGRPIGINMIVAAPDHAPQLGGRLATESNLRHAADTGTDLIFLYVRPHQRGTLQAMLTAAAWARRECGDQVMLTGVPSFSKPAPRTPAMLTAYAAEIEALLNAGCHGIGLPMPGSKQGWTPEMAAALVNVVHDSGGLAWLFLTSSVEGASETTIAQLAIVAKQTGADAYRLDEAGLSGMADLDNIRAFSLAIRGRRHTFRRMASRNR